MPAKLDRSSRVLRALGNRISEQGDMPIRIHRLTVRTLMRGVGLGDWDEGQDDFREIDALALDMLRHLAWKRLS